MIVVVKPALRSPPSLSALLLPLSYTAHHHFASQENLGRSVVPPYTAASAIAARAREKQAGRYALIVIQCIPNRLRLLCCPDPRGFPSTSYLDSYSLCFDGPRFQLLCCFGLELFPTRWFPSIPPRTTLVCNSLFAFFAAGIY